MSLRQLSAVVIELEDGKAILEFEDGSRRQVSGPDQIEILVGMPVGMVDTGDDAPIFVWGVEP